MKMKNENALQPTFHSKTKANDLWIGNLRESSQAIAQPQASLIAKVNARLAVYLHIKCGHQNNDYVGKTAKLGETKELTKHILDLK